MLRAAIVGCGLIAQEKHIPAFLKYKSRVEVAALCDLNEKLPKDTSSKFNVQGVYTDFDKMLDKEQIDIVDICTPPQTHSAIAIKALNKGVHVLVEKPMALTPEECDAMIEASEKNKRKLCVIHNQAAKSGFQKVKSMVAEGRIGKFRAMNIFFSTPTDFMTSKKDHWVHKLPAGALDETGPHAVYLSLAFLKNVKQAQVTAKKQLAEYPWSRFEDYRINLVGENGTSSIILNYSSNQQFSEIVVLGTEGIIKYDCLSSDVIFYKRDSIRPFSVGRSLFAEGIQKLNSVASKTLKLLSGNYKNGQRIIIEGFIDCILNDTESPVTAEEGREAVKVMHMLVKGLQANG